jgi:hypothetical protein
MTPDLPTRARTLADQITAILDRLDASHQSDDPSATYGRRYMHADISALMRGDGLAVVRELAGEVERLRGFEWMYEGLAK